MIELSIRFTAGEQVEDAPIGVPLFRPDTGASTPPALATRVREMLAALKSM